MKQLNSQQKGKILALKEEYKGKIETLWKESKQIDIFYGSHNLTRYKVDKAHVTTKLETLLDVVKDLEGLLE